jgi:tRNA-2-methylthio-N6-dimethylallyladenosine synthase
VDIFLKPSDIAGLLQFARERTQREPALPEAPAPVTPSVVASVPISYGCDHHCTYCIVRLRRGRHVSRPLPEVVEEARGWMARGAREVTLLGQNVDAYGQDLGPGAPDLADLLTAVHSIDGLWRIRFLTSHPAEMSDKLIRSVASLPRICPHFELPVQAGDDEVLQRMGRHYTVVRYRGLVDRIRALVPGCSIATDVIVGFPAESAAQFQATYDLVAGLHFDAVHIAKYSPRPSTPAARLADDVPPEEKERRRVALEELQTHIATEIHAAYLGQTVEVLVEERQRGRWKGRTINNRLVFFEDGSDWRGRLAHVHVEQTGAWSMRGSLVDWCPPGRDAETSGRESTLPLV